LGYIPRRGLVSTFAYCWVCCDGPDEAQFLAGRCSRGRILNAVEEIKKLVGLVILMPILMDWPWKLRVEVEPMRIPSGSGTERSDSIGELGYS